MSPPRFSLAAHLHDAITAALMDPRCATVPADELAVVLVSFGMDAARVLPGGAEGVIDACHKARRRALS